MNTYQALKNVGTLNSLNQAIRFIERHGEIVVGCDNFVITTLEGVYEFKELENGRVIVK